MFKELMKLLGWGGRDYSYLKSPEYKEKCRLAAKRRYAREQEEKEAERKRQTSIKMKRAWTPERRAKARERKFPTYMGGGALPFINVGNVAERE